MRGEKVFVRDAWDRPLVRRVWDSTRTVVYICNEERYRKLVMDYESVMPPIGFPIENVYLYDPALESVLMETYESDPNVWDQLTPYGERQNEYEWSEQESQEDDQREASVPRPG